MQCTVITGATGGLGMALATLLDSLGHELVLVGRDEIALQALNQSLGEKHTTVRADLASASDLAALIETLADYKIDVLINNAGLNEFGIFGDLPPDQIEQMFQVNVIAPMKLTQGLLSGLVDNKATVLNVGSVFSYIGFPFYVTYSATKFALRGFSEALYREYKDQGLKVKFIAPRAIATDMNDSRVQAMNQELGNRADTPDRVALHIVDALDRPQARCVIGFPEKLFARINGVLPHLVDKALFKQVAVMRKFANK
jgi:short-subunit dehydrogenase